MKSEFINHGKNSLIIFFCGFYTDANCFIEFDNCKHDLLFIYDYSDMNDNPLEYFDFLPYTQINVIAYSYGVWALNYIYNLDLLPQIDKSCCISGTYKPVDNTYGVNEKIFEIMELSLNLDVIGKFEQKMALGSSSCATIKKANRTVENLKEELKSIRETSSCLMSSSDFEPDRVILTKKDRIFPYTSQANFWTRHKNKLELECGHFPFFEFADFDEILGE